MLQLSLLLVAAVAGLVVLRAGSFDVMGLVALVAFGVVVLVQFLLGQYQPERTWHDGRAAAESVKHLAWRYAMKAEPFVGNGAADERFIKRVNDTLAEVKHLFIGAAGDDQITDWMREVRASGLLERKAIYVKERIEDQRRWYSAHAQDNRRNGRYWRLTLYAAGALGALGGLLKLITVVDFDVLGIAATLVTAIAAWMATKQFDALAVSYAVAAHELASAHSLASASASDDEKWSTFVNDTEDAISREHRLWIASRTG